MSPEWGGPSRAIASITNSLETLGVNCTIFAGEGGRLGTNSVKTDVSEIQSFRTGLMAKFWTGYSSNLSNAIKEAVGNHDIVHIHELWHFPHYAAYKSAISQGKPYCITTHGTLSPWALRHKYFRKQIYMWFTQRRILTQASYIHTITSQERQHIQDQGIHTPTVTIPNGVYIENLQYSGTQSMLLERYPNLKDKNIILFLGRIHPIKGLPLLAEAFSNLVKFIPNTYLVLAGPNEDGHQQRIKRVLTKLGTQEKVIFTGMLTETEKLDALNCADMLVVPSHSEVMSISALEAMASSLPVVITEESQFPEIGSYQAGIVVRRNNSDLLDAMIQILNNPDRALQMGRNGYMLASTKYHWNRLAPQYVDMYKSMIKP